LKLTTKIYLLQFTLGLILASFLSVTYFNYQSQYKKDLQYYVDNEVELHKKQLLSSYNNALLKFNTQKQLFDKIHIYTLEILKNDIDMDLIELKEHLSEKFLLENIDLNIFLIDKTYTIYKTTFSKDLGFNLSIVKEAKIFLDKSTKDSKIYISDLMSTDLLDMKYKLYSYSLLKNNTYLELGFIDNDIHNTFASIIIQNNDSKNKVTLYNIYKDDEQYYYHDMSIQKNNSSKMQYYKNNKEFSKNDKNYNYVINSSITHKAISIEDGDSIKIFTPFFEEDMYSKIGFTNIIMEIKVDISSQIQTMQRFENIFFTSIIVMLIFLVFVFIFIKNNFTKQINIIVSSINNKQPVKNKILLSKNDELGVVSKEYNILFESLNKEININSQLLKENKRFIADTVHQIRTPLTNIMMNSEMIKLTTKNNSSDEFIDQINSSINMLTNSYEDLSYIISNDSIEYKPTNLSLSEILKERESFFTTIAKVNFKEIITNIQSDINFTINQIELERLIDNNISNGIKYADTYKPIIINLTKNKDIVILEFKTYGKAILNPQKLFDKNYREDESKRGLGLGLNMVKGICEKYEIDYSVSYKESHNIFTYRFN